MSMENCGRSKVKYMVIYETGMKVKFMIGKMEVVVGKMTEDSYEVNEEIEEGVKERGDGLKGKNKNLCA